MPRVLIADVPEASVVLSACLEKETAVVTAESLEDALAEVRRGVDLVITGVHFADSQMLDLVRTIKSDPALRHLPLICVRLIGAERGPAVLSRLRPVLSSLEAVEFVDLIGLIQAIGAEEAFSEFRQRIRSRLAATRRTGPAVS